MGIAIPSIKDVEKKIAELDAERRKWRALHRTLQRAEPESNQEEGLDGSDGSGEKLFSNGSQQEQEDK